MKALIALQASSCAHDLPPALHGVKEFDELMQACDVIAALLKQLLQRALANAHVQTAEDDCIAGWELGLGISPTSPDLTLRREAVIAKLSSITVVNEASIMALVASAFGAVPYEASLDVDALTLTIETEGEAVVNIAPDGPVIAQAVEDTLRPVLPMNVGILNVMRALASSKLYAGGAAVASLQATIPVVNP